MFSCVIWLPPHVGRRVILLFSFVIFTFARSGRCGTVSSGSRTLDGTFFDSACDTTLSLPFFRTCNVTSALHEHQFEKLSFERESFRCRWQCARLFREIGFALRAFQHENSMSAPRASQMDQNCTKDCRDFDCRSFTASYELRLIKVCDEVSMCLCFWLTAVVARRPEQLPSSSC